MLKAAVSLLLLAIAANTNITSAEEMPPLAKAPFNAQQAESFQQQWASHIDRPVVYTNSIGMTLKLLPPGEFTMGRTEEQFDELLTVIDSDPDMNKQTAVASSPGRC